MRERAFKASVIVALSMLLLTLVSDRAIAAQASNGGSNSHLYFFTSDGCAPCRQVEPAIEQLHREGYPVTTVKIGDQPQLADRFQVDRTPTVILVTGEKITGRHAGQIDLPTLKQWFAAVGQTPQRAAQVVAATARPAPVRPSTRPSTNRARLQQPKPAAQGTKVVVNQFDQPEPQSYSADTRVSSSGFSSPTMLRGTTSPANRHEQRALAATVRLKVEDPKGISYATGTVIHSHAGESLVLTCGHVFRDARGTGQITAEYGFADGTVLTAPGTLVQYDAKARDIGLVTIRTQRPIEPVALAAEDAAIARGNRAFSVGCDHGQEPTIRHTAIKNRAAYDGSIKYDIYGRPVDGRSGGGLFTEAGELIGVCNAAAVEVDEGIYSAIDTIYWQLAQTQLTHLFTPDQRLASSTDSESRGRSDLDNRFAAADFSRDSFAAELSDRRDGRSGRGRLSRIKPRGQNTAAASPRTPVSFDRPQRASSTIGSDMEVIILVRSKSDPSKTEAITVAQPSSQLLDFLGQMQSANASSRQLDVAQLRKRIEYFE